MVAKKHQEDDSDAESDTESDADVYNLHEDNRDNSERESSFDNELLVSESSNSEILDCEDTETNSETDEDHVHQNDTTSLETSAGITHVKHTRQQRSRYVNCGIGQWWATFFGLRAKIG